MLLDNVDATDVLFVKDIILIIVPLLSLCATITAVIVGYKRSLKVVNIQTESSIQLGNRQIISPMRQLWIDNLRRTTSEFLNISERFYKFLHSDEAFRNFYKIHKMEIIPPDVDSKIDLLCLDITLMLNHTEDDHNRFIVLLDGLRKHIYDKDSTTKEFYNTYAEIVFLCKSILKREWERVKSNE